MRMQYTLIDTRDQDWCLAMIDITILDGMTLLAIGLGTWSNDMMCMKEIAASAVTRVKDAMTRGTCKITFHIGQQEWIHWYKDIAAYKMAMNAPYIQQPVWSYIAKEILLWQNSPKIKGWLWCTGKNKQCVMKAEILTLDSSVENL